MSRSVAAERRTPLGHPPLGGGVPEGRGLAPTPEASARADAAEWVRQNLPTCSAFAAAFKAVFAGLRLTFASEAGHTIGAQAEPPSFSVSGDDLVESLRRKEKAK